MPSNDQLLKIERESARTKLPRFEHYAMRILRQITDRWAQPVAAVLYSPNLSLPPPILWRSSPDRSGRTRPDACVRVHSLHPARPQISRCRWRSPHLHAYAGRLSGLGRSTGEQRRAVCPKATREPKTRRDITEVLRNKVRFWKFICRDTNAGYFEVIHSQAACELSVPMDDRLRRARVRTSSI